MLAGSQVFVQDVERIWSILMRIGFFLVPIFYSVDTIDRVWARVLLQINPLTQIMTFSRDVLIDGAFPSPLWLAYTVAFGAGLFALALRMFKWAEASFAERV